MRSIRRHATPGVAVGLALLLTACGGGGGASEEGGGDAAASEDSPFLFTGDDRTSRLDRPTAYRPSRSATASPGARGSTGSSVAWKAWYRSGLPGHTSALGVLDGSSSWRHEPRSRSSRCSEA